MLCHHTIMLWRWGCGTCWGYWSWGRGLLGLMFEQGGPQGTHLPVPLAVLKLGVFHGSIWWGGAQNQETHLSQFPEVSLHRGPGGSDLTKATLCQILLSHP